MSNAINRLAKWTAKTNPERVKSVLDELRPTMLANAQAVFPQLVDMENQTRQVLDGEGISVIQYPYYLCFARELWNLQRRGFSGDSLAREVDILIAKWTGRGLSPAVLGAIRRQVFTIAPVGP